ncbi:MAG: thymidylate kinase [Patescibacteria group bacterium]|nr:thymidylate kinase [Patescibacteria group bacterium]
MIKKKRAVKKGKLIVVDGADGSGKATQSALLARALRKRGAKVKAIDFPQYQQNFFGGLIGRYLAGEFGDFIQHDPYLASVLYAADRFETSKKIRRWLEDGYIVVADRYASANQIHQGSKITDLKKRKLFLDWLDEMEFDVFAIPRPDLVVYLEVPSRVSARLLKYKRSSNKKKYLSKTGAGRDVAESNLEHQQASRHSAMELVRQRNDWRQINCAPDGTIMPREAIHEWVIAAVVPVLKLKSL